MLNLSLSELRHVDELPYRTAIAAGVKLVMTSWAIYPPLDPHLPAGLSPAVIQGELRRHLGFRGITITDAITAAALARFGSPGSEAYLQPEQVPISSSAQQPIPIRTRRPTAWLC